MTLSNGPSSAIRAIGSLWFAAVLLVLWLVAMACATVYESTHGTEQALAAFYRAWWFKGLMALLAVNVLASLITRYPFSKRQIGFVITHAGILVVLAGAVVTKEFAVDGRVGVAEGQTVTDFTVGGDSLSIAGGGGASRAAVDLDPPVFGGFRTVEEPKAPMLTLGDVRAEVLRYVPDSEMSRRVLNDNPRPQGAVEVSLSPPGAANSTWLFAGRTAAVGPVRATFREFADEAELQRSLGQDSADAPSSDGTVKVEYQGSTFELSLSECTRAAVPLGDSGLTFRVLQYLPHAVVTPGGVRNASDDPANPAIQYEVIGSDENGTGWAFAKFPEFGSIHGMGGARGVKGVKVTFTAPKTAGPANPIEVLGAPDGGLYARFTGRDGRLTTRRLNLAEPVDTPWQGLQFTVLRRLDRARADWSVLPVDPVRETRVPAVLLRLTTPAHSEQMWLQKYRPRPVTIDGEPYELVYGDKTVPLGFELTLDWFRVGYYPGEERPRSFESQITILEPTTGREQSRVVSMNHPAKVAGYSFYQSSYHQDAGRTISYLSVAWDPGQPVVFAGYIGTLAGMLVVLGTRVADRRRAARQRGQGGGSGGQQAAGPKVSSRQRAQTAVTGSDRGRSSDDRATVASAARSGRSRRK